MLPVFDLFACVVVAIRSPQTGMADPLRLQLGRCSVLAQDGYTPMTVGVETTTGSPEFFEQGMEHALTDVSGVNWSGIPRPKHAARRATRKVLPEEVGELGCDVDNALTARRFGLLFDPLDDATPNANHAVGKIKIIDVQSSSFTDAHAGGRQYREQGPILTLGRVDDLLYLVLCEIALFSTRCLREFPFPRYPNLLAHNALNEVDDLEDRLPAKFVTFEQRPIFLDAVQTSFVSNPLRTPARLFP